MINFREKPGYIVDSDHRLGAVDNYLQIKLLASLTSPRTYLRVRAQRASEVGTAANDLVGSNATLYPLDER
jgi:hypothetical protein